MLHRALAYTYAPRIVTLLATIVALPVVTSGLGAREYGMAAAVSALGAIVQVISDGGLSAAVSRAIAEAATGDSDTFGAEVRAWTRAQIIVAAVAFVLMVGIGLLFGRQLVPGITPVMVIIIATTLTAGTFNGYLRALLRTRFSFRRMSVMDVGESLSRSAAWIVVGLRFPKATWLLLGEMLSATTALTLGALLCARLLRPDLAGPKQKSTMTADTWRRILGQGGIFLLVRVATIGLTQVPVLVAGRIGQIEIAAVLAALLRLLDLINGPIVVIGQVVGIKSVAAVKSATAAVRHRLWQQTARICASWSAVVGGFVLLSTPISRHMLPDVPDAPMAFALFGVFLLLHELASTFGLPIDYLGSAAQRVRLMVPIVFLQATMLALAGTRFGAVGAVLVLDACYLVLVIGYLRLAHRVMGGDGELKAPADAKIIWAMSGGWVLIGLFVQNMWGLGAALIAEAVVGTLAVLTVAQIPVFRTEYSPLRLLNLDGIE